MSLFQTLKTKLAGVPTVEEVTKEVPAHMQRFVGKSEWVFHEIVSDHTHVDVHVIPPAPDRPYSVLFTTGMSLRPMKGPSPAGISPFAELMIFLPESWPLSDEGFNDEANYWPIRELKKLARLPHQMGFLLREFMSVPFSNPPRPAPGTEIGGFWVMKPTMWVQQAQSVKLPSGSEIQLYALVPLTMDEMSWKANQLTGEAFMGVLHRQGKTLMDMLVLDPNRASLVHMSGQ